MTNTPLYIFDLHELLKLPDNSQQMVQQACRGVFDDEQNALRARSIQRVQLWKGLQPSALSEAVSHFAKVTRHAIAMVL